MQDYIECIIKKHETLTAISPIRDRYKAELQIPEIMKLFGSTKNLITKTKNGENVQIYEVIEVFLLPCNLVDNQYHQKSEVLYTFTPNQSYA